MYKFLEKPENRRGTLNRGAVRHPEGGARCRQALGLSANYGISEGAESASHPEGGARCRQALGLSAKLNIIIRLTN